MSLLRQLHALCEAQGITLSMRHLPGVPYLWADRISRLCVLSDWILQSAALPVSGSHGSPSAPKCQLFLRFTLDDPDPTTPCSDETANLWLRLMR
jgi:hypothetical protein